MVSLEKLAMMNPWWSKGKEFKHYDMDLSNLGAPPTVIKFERLERLYARLAPGKVFIIKGPRRIGKTLLLKLLIERLLDSGLSGGSVFYFSFDTLVTKKELDNMLRDFLMSPGQSRRYILLDEVQNVSGWEEVIKALYDAGMLRSSTVVATGSVAHMLKGEQLPGRGMEGNTLLLRHLTFRDLALVLLREVETEYGVNRVNTLLNYEFTNGEMKNLYDYVKSNAARIDDGLGKLYERARGLKSYSVPIFKLFEVYLMTGGYPISINDYLYNFLSTGENLGIADNVYEEIYNYAKQDASTIGGESAGDPAKASRIMESIVGSVGTSVSYSSVARRLGMNAATTLSYFKRLENSFVYTPIQGLDSHLAEMRKSKIYFSDVFLHYACGAKANGMHGSSYTQELLGSSERGIVVEEAVLDHLIKAKEQDPMKHYGTYVRFYNDNGELDFLYKLENGKYVAVESKYRNSAQASMVKRVKGIEDYLILSKDTIDTAEHIATIPAAFLLLLLQKSDSNL